MPCISTLILHADRIQCLHHALPACYSLGAALLQAAAVRVEEGGPPPPPCIWPWYITTRRDPAPASIAWENGESAKENERGKGFRGEGRGRGGSRGMSVQKPAKAILAWVAFTFQPRPLACVDELPAPCHLSQACPEPLVPSLHHIPTWACVLVDLIPPAGFHRTTATTTYKLCYRVQGILNPQTRAGRQPYHDGW
jgi:hypothetical protein